MRSRYRIIAAIALAIGLSFARSGGSLSNLAYHLGLFDRQGMQEAIALSITQYNKNSAGFYSTAGESREGLAVIPASRMLKRRLFQDINMLKSEGIVMVFDLDKAEVLSTDLLDRHTAVVRSREVWAVALQDMRTRRPIFNVKAVDVNVRYLLRDETGPGGERVWTVYEADVYPQGASIPEPNIRRVL